MNVLEVDSVAYAYGGGRSALRSVSFGVEAGEVVGLLGRNGAGKTTLLRIVMGLLRAREGSVRVFGLNPQREPVSIKRRVGFVAEDQVLPPHMRISSVLDLHRALFPSWDRGFEGELMLSFRLDARARIASLSKGEARRVALLCAVAHKPELLILDEPAGGLDPAARREFLETVITLLNREGSTILFSSHQMADVERIAGRTILLHEGEVVLDEPLDELRDGICLAVTRGLSIPQLLATRGCVRARARDGVSHSLFRGDPEDVAVRLGGDARCTRISLEDFFIEMVEGRE